MSQDPRGPAQSQPSTESKSTRRRKPYVKPSIVEAEPLENVTLLSGGVNPTTANPFVGG